MGCVVPAPQVNGSVVGRGRRIAGDAAIACAIALVLAAAQVEAQPGRVFAWRPAIVRVAGPADALTEWRRAGVRGRTLVHAARRIALGVEPSPVTTGNFVQQAVREDLVRRIIHVVPEAD
jgi:hypothetical protein